MVTLCISAHKTGCLSENFRFVEPPVLDMASVVEDSSTRTPLIFVLSPGVVSRILPESWNMFSLFKLVHRPPLCDSFVTQLVLPENPLRYIFVVTKYTVTFFTQDPTSALLQLAENSGMSNRFHALSLGQGQAPIATRMIKEGVKDVG